MLKHAVEHPFPRPIAREARCAPEVVVVGGGPAGLAAAIAVARHGIATTLFEARAFAVDKACGEGILPSGVTRLERLGIPRNDLERLGRPFVGVRYISEDGHSACAEFSAGIGLGVRRVILSERLLAQARALPALKI